MSFPILSSIQVGQPRQWGQTGTADPWNRPWRTGFFKNPVAGPIQLVADGLAGDGQADLVHHGGPDKAVLAYSADHYFYWHDVLNRSTLPYGAFGENFTITGQSETGVCIGDTWQVGEGVVVQVSQPRQPCWKLGRRWKIKSLPLQVQQTGKTGWYFRVLVAGTVEAEMPLTLLERPHPEWTVARANRLMHVEKDDLRAASELAHLPQLSESWRNTLRNRTEQRVDRDTAPRLLGGDGQ